MDAIDERISKAPVARVEKFGEALFTRRRIGRDEYLRGSILSAAFDAKLPLAAGFQRFRRNVVDSRQPGLLFNELPDEAFDGMRLTFDLYPYGADLVSDESAKIQA